MINDVTREKRKALLSPEEAAEIVLSGNIFSKKDNSRALKVAEKFYEEKLDMFAKTFDIEPDPLMVAAWFGFNVSLSQGYKSAYEALRILIQDINAVYGWDFFQDLQD